jgi:hypothetical protein
MADEFLIKTKCDRCGGSLDDGWTMSRFDTTCLCMRCAEAERHPPDYERAVDAEMESAKAIVKWDYLDEIAPGHCTKQRGENHEKR